MVFIITGFLRKPAIATSKFSNKGCQKRAFERKPLCFMVKHRSSRRRTQNEAYQTLDGAAVEGSRGANG